jgi:hypothetical protein
MALMAKYSKAKKPKEKPNKADKYQDHGWVIRALDQAQEADHDNRERAREAHEFVATPGGQWEPEWWRANDKKPRYQFDKTTPIVEQIAGELEKADFAIEVAPAGGSVTTDDADLVAGIVRAIENHSDARTKVYSHSARGMIISGIDGWRVVQKYADADSFDQDLVIEKVHNFVDRVWFDLDSEEQDHSDANHCWLMHAYTPEKFEELWPDRSRSDGLMNDSVTGTSSYWNKRDVVPVGEFYYVKHEKRTLAKLSDGRVLEMDDNFAEIQDDLEAAGITVVQTRERLKPCVYVRKFDAHGWLDEPEKTVFKHIPVVAEYANFRIIDNKLIYWGAVQKLMDPQRVLNYSLSREVEEGALAPREKYWLTQGQAEGYEDTLQTLNTNTDPVQFFNVDERLGPNQITKIGGANINPGLRTISQSMNETINEIAGLFAANMGDNPNAQSGVAIRQLQNKGDLGTYGYTRSHEIALCYTFKVIVGAIPEIYDGDREVRIINDDRTEEVVAVNRTVFDQQTGRMVTVHDLTSGVYKVTCRAGPAFQNRQQETVEAITRIAQVDPTPLQLGGDVLYSNISAPGMDLIAERLRQQLFNQGMIPFKQMTDEEKQQFIQAQQAQQNQPPPEDPMMVAAQAEMVKAQTEAQDKQVAQQEKMAKIQLESRKQDREDAKLQLTQQESMMEQMFRSQQQQFEQQQFMVNLIKSQAEILEAIRNAMGAQAIMSPDVANAYQKQAERLSSTLGPDIPEFEYDPVSGVLGDAPTE